MNASPLGSARRIAFTAGGAFAAFYIFYTAAPVAFASATLDAGTRVSIVMFIVVAVQPLVDLLGRRVPRQRQITAAAISMGIGSAIMPFAGHWPGMLLFGAGFGIFVVASTAWIKETAPTELLGTALGIYGFGSAIGGALGAPIGLILIQQVSTVGTAVVSSGVALASLLPALHVKTATRSNTAPARNAASQTARTARLWNRSGLIGLGAHLLAVTIYAAALSDLASGQTGRETWLPVLAAFAIQGSLAIGRMTGGWAVTRWPPLRVGAPAFIVLALGASGIALFDPLPVLTLAATIGVGLASGACQTVALTWLMQRAGTTAGLNRASAAWNICFDIGLGLGAFSIGMLK